MQNEKIVFCDTMVWYNLSENKMTFDKTKYQYFGSASNLSDFLSSKKKSKNKEEETKLKNAIKCMSQNADGIFLVDPVSFGASNLFGLNINQKEVNEIKKTYEQLLRYANNEVKEIKGETIESMIDAKKRFQEGAFNFKQDYNQLCKNKKFTKGKEVEEKNQLLRDNIERWLFNEWNKIYYKSQFINDICSLNWKSIEVFVKTYAIFIDSIKSELPNPQTMIDLLQLLYITNEGQALIWTEENKLLKKITDGFPNNKWKNIIYPDLLSRFGTD